MSTPVPSSSSDGTRSRDAERTKTEILNVATKEFARQGFAGARVDEIAARTSTTKRMIYYYFGGKEQLYVAVLEQALEAVLPGVALPECGIDPLEEVRQLAGRMFGQAQRYPELIRLMIIENVHEARYLNESARFRALRSLGIGQLEAALAEGVTRGTIRKDVEAADVLMIISSFCTYRIANRFTFRQFTGCDLLDASTEAHQRELLDTLLTSYLRPATGPH